MSYSEAAYFGGFHFQHIAAWQEQQRLERIDASLRLLARRRTCRHAGINRLQSV
jgi:predicted flap endonuclease-1-like 5' DNA nuclease